MEMPSIDVTAATECRAAFTCDPAALADAATYLARRIVSRRSTVPTLACVHIVAHISATDSGSVTLTATNLDQWASVTVPATVEAPGEFCTDAGALADVLAKARKDKDCRAVRFDDGARVAVKARRGGFNLQRLPVDDFPLPPTMGKDGQPPLSAFTMPASRLLQDMAMLAPCMSTEETKYYLRGVAVQRRELAGQARLVMAATDGKALGATSRPIPAGAEELPDVILPDAAVHALLKAAKLAPTEEIEIAHAADQTRTGSDDAPLYIGERFRFRLGPVTIWSKAVEGTFPAWERIFDGDGETEARQPALFPDLLPGVPLPTMDKLTKAAGAGVTWQDAPFGLVGALDSDPDVLFGTWRDPAGACAKRSFEYVGEHGSGEITGPDGVTYPVAFTNSAIHFSAAQVRALIGESCFETMEIGMPDGSRAHILKWLWDDGASRFLTVRQDGRTYDGAPYVTRAEIEAAEPIAAGMPAIACQEPAEDVSEPCAAQDSAEPVEALGGAEIAPQPVDAIGALLDRLAELEARLSELPVESEAPAARRVSLSVTIDMPAIPVAADNVIPLPRDPRAIAAARARLALDAERPRRSAAHERVIRRAWAERKEARRQRMLRVVASGRADRAEAWAQENDRKRKASAERARRMVAQQRSQARAAEAERLRVADLAREARGKRRRAVTAARGRLSRLRTVAGNHRQHAAALSTELARIKRDMADPSQPERASDVAQLLRERDTARTALAASQARCERQEAAISSLSDAVDRMASRVARAEAATRRAA